MTQRGPSPAPASGLATPLLPSPTRPSAARPLSSRPRARAQRSSRALRPGASREAGARAGDAAGDLQSASEGEGSCATRAGISFRADALAIRARTRGAERSDARAFASRGSGPIRSERSAPPLPSPARALRVQRGTMTSRANPLGRSAEGAPRCRVARTIVSFLASNVNADRSLPSPAALTSFSAAPSCGSSAAMDLAHGVDDLVLPSAGDGCVRTSECVDSRPGNHAACSRSPAGGVHAHRVAVRQGVITAR
jgi:hypothetical protein